MLAPKTLALLSGLVGAVTAQTPNGWLFTPNTTTSLNVTFANNNNVQPAGEVIPRADALEPPTLRLNNSILQANETAILFLIDLDVPQNGTRVPIVHWLVPGVKNNNGTLNVPVPSNSSTASPKVNGTYYAPPNPPAGDSAHRYVFLLFQQPANYSIPAAYNAINPPANTTARLNFNITQFLNASNIRNEPLAANFIQVQNTTAPTATTSFPPLSTGAATSTVTSRPTGGAASSRPATASSTAGANALSYAVGAAGAGVFGLAAVLL